MTFTYGVPFRLRYSVSAASSSSFGGFFGALSSASAKGSITYRWLGMTGLPSGATVTSASGVDWSKPAP